MPPSTPANETTQIIYSMQGVTKEIDRKKILNNVSISYYYGAKIGVLGLNGSGKSTLLRIIAGVDKNYEGKITAAGGYTIGYLEQEPLKHEKRTVEEVIREGCGEGTKLLEEFDRLNEKLCDPDITPDDMADPKSAVFHLARAASPTPALITPQVVERCREAALPPQAIVELVCWLAVLQMFHRLTAYCLAAPDQA